MQSSSCRIRTQRTAGKWVWLVALVFVLSAQPAAAGDDSRDEGADSPAPSARALSLVEEGGQIALADGHQKIVFRQDTEGRYVHSTYVRRGDIYMPMFDGERPIWEGPDFDLRPTRYEVLSDTEQRLAVVFRGEQEQHGFAFEMLVELTRDNPFIKVRVTSFLTDELVLSEPGPTVAFWNTTPEVTFHLDQGPDSIYGDVFGRNNFGNNFPAAYLWHDGLEAIAFFDFTSVQWMGPQNLNGFFDTRVAVRSKPSGTGLGLHPHGMHGDRLPPGEMTVEMYLLARQRPDRPSGLEALDTMVRALAPLHPSDAPRPENFRDGVATWEFVSQQTIEDLLDERNWNDRPLQADDPLLPGTRSLEFFRASPGHPPTDGTAGGYDFTTVNNVLSPWIAISRLDQNPRWEAFLRPKIEQLPLFFDPKAGMIRWGTRINGHIGDMEMTWQNLNFHGETVATHEMLGPEAFHPAVAGNFLDATRGLRVYAHNVDYVFPQWFDPYTKEPLVQNDVPELGVVREPWQVGMFAYNMLKAYEITQNPVYLEEAKASIRHLMGGVSYTVENDVYERTYDDPVEFPITELFGNSYGTAAAEKIYHLTGEAEFRRYSQDFLHVLLRLTAWYDDSMDEKGRSLNNLGLFAPHGGAYHPVSWETVEAYKPLTIALKHNEDLATTDLLLKLYNLQRLNSFYFYPPFWTEHFADRPAYDHRNAYLPVEPFYMSGAGGHTGTGALYMASLGLWNYLMCEAVAEATDPAIMVLNLDLLDGYELSVASLERNLIVYNPTDQTRDVVVAMKALKEGTYDVQVRGPSGQIVKRGAYQSESLEEGVGLMLDSLEYARIHLARRESEEQAKTVEQYGDAQERIAYAYALVRQQVQRQVRSVLAEHVGHEAAEAIAPNVGVLVDFERAAIAIDYALDRRNDVADVAEFLRQNMRDDWQPNDEWKTEYEMQTQDWHAEPQQALAALETAQDLYREEAYAEATRVAEAQIIAPALEAPVLESLSLTAEQTRLATDGATSLSVRGFLSDGRPVHFEPTEAGAGRAIDRFTGKPLEEDVSLAFAVDDEAGAEVNVDGTVRAKRPGEVTVTVEVSVDDVALQKTAAIHIQTNEANPPGAE